MPRTDLDTEYVGCRTFGHAWDDKPARDDGKLTPRAGNLIVRILCLRCTSHRVDEVTKRGKVVRRRYQYVAGYLRPKGSDHVPREDWRAAYLRVTGLVK